MRTSLYVWTAAAVILACSAGLTSAASFRGLGHMPGMIGSSAAGVSADGQVVAGNFGGGPFRWTAGDGMVGIGHPPGSTYTAVSAISADGSTIVGWSDLDAFRWTEASGSVKLVLHDDGVAFDVSADGTVVIGHTDSGGPIEAYRWTPTLGQVRMGDLPGGYFNSSAFAVSDDGSVIVGSGHSDNGLEAFRWTESGGMVGLGMLSSAETSYANSISPDGSVLAGWSGSDLFRWTEAGGMVGLGNLPGCDRGHTTGISADGAVIVGSSSFPNGHSQAFIWDSDGGILSLHDALVDMGVDLAGWTLQQAQGISADGRVIIGNGLNPAGQYEAWIAIVPEPASLSLLLLGGLTLLRRSR